MTSFSFNIRKPTITGKRGTIIHEFSGYTTQCMTKGKPVNLDLMSDVF